MKRLIIVLSFAFIFLITTFAWAYGPSTHMREADQFIIMCELNPSADPQYNANLLRRERPHLRLGAIWPDIANVIVPQLLGENAGKGGNSHVPEFNDFILQDALDSYPQDQWKIAFAMGGLMHCMGDIVAQDMLTQHLAVIGHTGEMDVVVDMMDDHPGGEIEALIEGGLEIMQPRFDLYSDMIDYFIKSASGLTELFRAVNYYLPLYEEYFGLEQHLDTRKAFRMAVYLLSHPREIVPSNVDPVIYRFVESGFTRFDGLAEMGIDTDELIRILTGPVLSREFWDEYFAGDFFALSSTMMLDYAPGNGYFDNFPIWSAKMMKSGVIQSLAFYLPDDLTIEDSRFVADLVWCGADGLTPISSIDAASPPATVTLKVTFYDVPSGPDFDDVTVLVREDSTSAAIVAYETDNVAVDPWTYGENEMAVIEVTFDPSAAIGNEANGLHVELIQGDDPDDLPYFTTDWTIYETIAEIDMTKAAYTMNYGTYNQWPNSLKINY